MKVLVFGYSESLDRFSNIATNLLKEYKHEVLTINPRMEAELSRINTEYDTLTLYVNPQIGDKFADMLLKSKPKRVIFNPGTENSNLQKKFEAMGVEVVIGCTLVMLRSNQFDG
ncbi:MAG: CoA-binding protein [Bacteriovorax sp.]|nr:CoA-binding protein [Bacteriovorax sp.]